jgi:hypothetical protein
MKARIIQGSDFPEVAEAPVSWGSTNQVARGFKAIVNPKTGKIFSIVSREYRLIRHEEAVDFIKGIVESTDGMGDYELILDFHDEGSRMTATYRFLEFSLDIGAGDSVCPELHLFNSYDARWSFTVLLGAFRFVCTNGLVIGKKFFHLRSRHFSSFDPEHAREQIASAFDRFKRQADEWRQWQYRQISLRQYRGILKAMNLGKRAAGEIETRILEEAKGSDQNGLPIISLWGFYNVLTWYITHRAVSLNHRVEMEKRLRAALSRF